MSAGTPGRWLQVVACAHAAVGIATYRRSYAEIARDGVVDTVPDHGERAAAFWFLAAAPALWLIGRLMRSAERSGDTDAQRAAGGVLVALGTAGAAVMPRSGFWAVVAIGIAALRRRRRAR